MSAATRLGTQAAHNLARTGQCTFGPGMTDAELSRVEQEYGFEFAEDHRAFLAHDPDLRPPLPTRRTRDIRASRALDVGNRHHLFAEVWRVTVIQPD
jgi:hypothetical protein